MMNGVTRPLTGMRIRQNLSSSALKNARRLATESKNPSVQFSASSSQLSRLSQRVSAQGAQGIRFGYYNPKCNPLNEKTDPNLEFWRRNAVQIARKDGLDFYNTHFWFVDQETMLQTAARGGFPTRYPHYSFGQEYENLRIPNQYGLQKLYELVINHDPAHAYLLKSNPAYAQKVVVAHVLGHSDFFKNNYMFRESNRKMLGRMGDHSGIVRRIMDKERVSFEEMEKFIDKVHSIQWLIDMGRASGRPLQMTPDMPQKIRPIPDEWGRVDVSGLPRHMDRIFNPDKRIVEEREAETQRREAQLKQFPQHPDRDVIAFIMENSTVLKPWQRDVLSMLRDESYYFTPQWQTKIMNEGWASYWHCRLMHKPELADTSHAVEISDMIAGVFAMSKTQINPYTIGYTIFKDIEERWNKGRHGKEWEAIKDRKQREEYDTHEMNGYKKIFEVRERYNDYQFIQEFFTPEIAEKLKLFTWEPNDTGNGRPSLEIASRQFEEIKRRLLGMLENGGKPLIRVIDGNYQNRGELCLEHVYAYDLKFDWAVKTLQNIHAMWGRPVHLLTSITDPDSKKLEAVRISVDGPSRQNVHLAKKGAKGEWLR